MMDYGDWMDTVAIEQQPTQCKVIDGNVVMVFNKPKNISTAFYETRFLFICLKRVFTIPMGGIINTIREHVNQFNN